MTILLAMLATAPAATANVGGAAPEAIIVTGERTEGEDAYGVRSQTTTTRFPISQRDTPQSISVVTRAQIEDFKLNDINSLLATVPGVNVQPSDTDRVYYSARGFEIQTFQTDGVGLPFAFGIQTGSIDTAVYDHIDVVRGAPGLLSSTGNPSAVINFIRKRPHIKFQASADAQYGSFDKLRLNADISVPITQDGSIRARAVGVYDNSDSHLDRYHLRRWTGYGIVETDLNPDTTLSVGYGHQDHQSKGAMWGALPLYYTDGSRIDLPRSASTGADWAGWGVIDRQIFGDIVHHFNTDWHAKLTVNRRAVSENDELFYVYGNPDRATGLGILTYPGAFQGETRNLTIEAYLAGKVGAHDMMFGVNRSAQDYKQYSSYDYSLVGLALPLSVAFDGTFPKVNFPTPFNLSLDTHTNRETGYGLVRLHVTEPLKVMVGANLTHAKSEGVSYGEPTSYDRTRFLPFVGATLDLSAVFSAYASYATIFNPQSQIDAAGQILAPIEGDNIEAGVKGEWFGGRLNASLAMFQARQKNTAESRGFVGGRTIYVGVDATSQGIEFEFSGQLAEGLNATGGYTAMRIRGEDEEPVRTFVPRNTARLNLTYSPVAMPKLQLGVSAQYQSRMYIDVPLASGGVTRLIQKKYATIELLAKYHVTPKLSVSGNLKNATNTKYLGALNYDQAFYAAPRTVLCTVSLKY